MKKATVFICIGLLILISSCADSSGTTVEEESANSSSTTVEEESASSIGTIVEEESADSSSNPTDEENSDQIYTLNAPYIFDSADDFEQFIGSDNTPDSQKSRLSDQYALTNKTPDGFTFSSIYYREDVYIASYYAVDGYNYSDTYDEYENERLSTAIYQVSLFPDAQESLKINYIDKDFEPMELGGKTYYYMPEYAKNGDLIGHEFAFVASDNLMYVHLPASISIDDLSVENSILAVD
jgi:hypothetical protein